MLGFEPNSQDKIPSFANPDERTPSLHLYDDHWYDFAAGKGGDVIDFVRAVYPEMSINDVLWKLWRKALNVGKEPGDVERQPVRNVVDFSQQLAGLTYDRSLIDVWEERLGVPIPASCRHVATVDLAIPHADQDGVYGVKVRASNGAKSAWPGSQFTKRLYHSGGWATTAVDSDVVITEGESDAWAMQSVLDPRVLVLALPSGAQSWKDSWLDTDLRGARSVRVCLDNDTAGREARVKLLTKIDRSRSLMVPDLFNDAREAIAAGWQPAL